MSFWRRCRVRPFRAPPTRKEPPDALLQDRPVVREAARDAVDSLAEAEALHEELYSEDTMRSNPDLAAALDSWNAGDRLPYLREFAASYLREVHRHAEEELLWTRLGPLENLTLDDYQRCPNDPLCAAAVEIFTRSANVPDEVGTIRYWTGGPEYDVHERALRGQLRAV
jgi:hypothetical protein